MGHDITPEDILDAYRIGIFPMADHATDEDVYWVDPQRRGIIPLDGFHVSASFRKFLKKRPYSVSINRDFVGVISACAEANDLRRDTWINPQIRQWYTELHRMGHAHSFECHDENGVLVGGLYGLAINGAFFGESMFSKSPNASKVALVHLVAHLKRRAFSLLDCQFVNPHLLQFGCIEIPRKDYHSLLAGALASTGVSFGSSSEIYSSIAASVADCSASVSSTVFSGDSDWDAALGSLQSSTVTS